MRTTVFLDRDGVINRKMPEGRYVTRLEEFVLLPGALRAIGLLKATGCIVVMVTNQRGVARGLIPELELSRIHRYLQDEILERASVRLDGLYCCPHEEGACGCRKPALGLFMQAREDLPEIDFGHAVLVGDSLSDLEAGAGLGCRNVLITRGRNNRLLLEDAARRKIPVHGVAGSLLGATTRHILPLVRAGRLPCTI